MRFSMWYIRVRQALVRQHGRVARELGVRQRHGPNEYVCIQQYRRHYRVVCVWSAGRQVSASPIHNSISLSILSSIHKYITLDFVWLQIWSASRFLHRHYNNCHWPIDHRLFHVQFAAVSGSRNIGRIRRYAHLFCTICHCHGGIETVCVAISVTK